MQHQPTILVTNDDGIDSDGLLALAQAMVPLGRVVIVAPDGEHSGAGAAIGPIWESRPEVHEVDDIDGIDATWAVSGPPALCVLYARLGAFDFRPDLIVSGINPGANVGRSVYHSGTIGACLTGRIGGIPGVAVSQAVSNYGVEGQAWGDVIAAIDWSVAATIAQEIVAGVLAEDTPGAGVLNVNVPPCPLDEIKGSAWTQVGSEPARAMIGVNLEPKPGHKGSYVPRYVMGEEAHVLAGSDVEAMHHNQISLTWLSPIVAEPKESSQIDRRLQRLVGPARAV